MGLRNIIVTMKVVPKIEELEFDPETKTIKRGAAGNEINPADKNALELALRVKERHGGKVIVVSMGPPFWEPYLKLAIAMGADDAILVSDRALAGSDTLPTTLTLSRAISRVGDYDIILCGEESSDGGTGQVPSGVAEWLGIPHVTFINDFMGITEDGKARVKRTIKGGHEIVEVDLPFLGAVEFGSNTPRFPDFRRKRWAEKEFKLTVWSASDLGLSPEEIGLRGSATTVVDLEEVRPPTRMKKKFIGPPEELALKLVEILKDLT